MRRASELLSVEERRNVSRVVGERAGIAIGEAVDEAPRHERGGRGIGFGKF